MTQAFIVVDGQNDFCEGGALGVTGGAAALELIARHLTEHHDEYDLIVASRDWHTPDSTNGGHFHTSDASPDYDQTWPAHCVQGTYGAQYHAALTDALPFVDLHILKGQGAPAYSAFEGVNADSAGPATLAECLRAYGIDEVHIAGIATDYCVQATSLDAMAIVSNVTVHAYMCAAVSGDDAEVHASLTRAGVNVVREATRA